jgi:hypothetical protein
MLAEAGCTLPEIVSITGHTLRRAQDILDKYLGEGHRVLVSARAPSRCSIVWDAIGGLSPIEVYC